jgi:hypothetical protein
MIDTGAPTNTKNDVLASAVQNSGVSSRRR